VPELKKLASVVFVLMMVISCLHLTSFSVDAATTRAIIEMTGDPDATFRDIAWQKDGQYAVAVGNDSANNGVIYHYDPYTDDWNPLRIEPDDRYNGVTHTDPYFWIDWMEGGINGWTTKTWSGTLNWHQVDPSTLPIPPSGQSHGAAHSGSTVWWFGNDATGDYNDGNTIKTDLISPAIYLPDVSTMGAVVLRHWFEVEAYTNPVDIMRISIKNTTDSGWYQLASWDGVYVNNNGPLTDWTQEILDLTGWLGNHVQLNFSFDSLDASQNGFAGWHCGLAHRRCRLLHERRLHRGRRTRCQWVFRLHCGRVYELQERRRNEPL